MRNYNLQNLISLCREINLPQDVISEIPNVWENINTDAILPHINALTKPETCESAYNTLREIFNPAKKCNSLRHCETASPLCSNNDLYGIKMLAAQLCAALRTRELYLQKGIDKNIFIATMKSFSRFVNEHYVSYEHYGFDRGWWTYRHLCIQLFRLGVLEFELYENALSVHIPSDAVMTTEALDDSYKCAKIFYAEQKIDYTEIFCRTWLLSPMLKEVLPPHSRILNFQKDYEILELYPDTNSFMMWVFKRKYDDMNRLPEKTFLQREIKKLLLAGEILYGARGRYNK